MSIWIFLRGLTRESRHWGDFPATFRRRIADAEVIMLDLPGNGRLHRQQSPASVEAVADWCHRESVGRGLTPPYHLLAMSLGAMVAVEWASRHADEIAGCVLINTSLRPFSPPHWRLRPGGYAALLRLALPGCSPEEREAAILRLTSRQAPSPATVSADWAAWHREHPVSRCNALRQLLAAARYRAPAARPLPSLLLLAGARDALVDARCSRQIARRWQCSWAEHPSAGHDLPLDDGPWVAAQVRAWLEAKRSP